MKNKKHISVAQRKKLEKIAKIYLNIDTLEARLSDDLDFYDCAVWRILDALNAAYLMGKEDK